MGFCPGRIFRLPVAVLAHPVLTRRDAVFTPCTAGDGPPPLSSTVAFYQNGALYRVSGKGGFDFLFPADLTESLMEAVMFPAAAVYLKGQGSGEVSAAANNNGETLLWCWICAKKYPFSIEYFIIAQQRRLPAPYQGDWGPWASGHSPADAPPGSAPAAGTPCACMGTGLQGWVSGRQHP